jgi:hypothetical protein
MAILKPGKQTARTAQPAAAAGLSRQNPLMRKNVPARIGKKSTLLADHANKALESRGTRAITAA